MSPPEAPRQGAPATWLDAARAALPPQRLRQILATLSDQGLVAVGGFVLNVLLARNTPQADYGVFVLAYSAINFTVDLQNSLLLEPMMVFAPGTPASERPAYLGTVLAFQAAFVAILMLGVWVGCAAWWALGSGSYAWTTIMFAPIGMAGVQCREFARKVFFATFQPGRALGNDGLYVALLLSGLAVAGVYHRLSGAVAFAILGGAGLLTAIVGVVKVGVRLPGSVTDLRNSARRHWAYGRWMIGVSGARWSGNELYYWVAAAFLGPAGSAALKAAQNVFAPVGLFLSGLGNVFLPIASQLAGRSTLRTLNRFAAAIGAVLGPLVLAYVVAVTLGSSFVFRALYHGRYAEYAYLLPLIGIGHVLVASFQGPSIGLRALERTRSIFVITTLSAAATLVAVLPFTARWGLAGAVCATLLSVGVGSPLWVVMYRRAVRERTAGARIDAG